MPRSNWCLSALYKKKMGRILKRKKQSRGGRGWRMKEGKEGGKGKGEGEGGASLPPNSFIVLPEDWGYIFPHDMTLKTWF